IAVGGTVRRSFADKPLADKRADELCCDMADSPPLNCRDDNTRQRERLRHSRACHAGATAVPDVPNQHSCNTGSGVTSRDCFVSQEGTMPARILSFALTFVAS